MKIKETKCKSIISKSGIYDVKYSINPYTGCEHNCKYCYATFMKKFSNHSEKWGQFVDVKINAREALEDDLLKMKKGSILLSSVTDPYQPIEKKYKITRKILERLANTKFSVNILTKSDLILRDLDILKEFNSSRIAVGFTINFLDEKHRKIWEPKSSKIKNRINALQKISNNKIGCYVHVGPYFEEITDLKGILEKVEKFSSELQIEDINLEGKEGKIMSVIQQNYPELKETYESIKRNRFQFQNKLREKVRNLRKSSNIPIRLFLD